jgi:hypothetical protein
MLINSRVSNINKSAFQERIKKINKNIDKRNVWECIDKPIRPLIFELARVGMIPKFCCCGYSYENEEEPKTHHALHAYVHFYSPHGKENELNNIFQLSKMSGWDFSSFCKIIWEIRAKNPVPDNMYRKNDGIEEAIHQYEGYGLKIERLTALIQLNMPTINDPVTIIDGNSLYAHCKTWIVKPKQSFIIGVKDYYKKYGKYNESFLKETDEDRLGIKLVSLDNFNNYIERMKGMSRND